MLKLRRRLNLIAGETSKGADICISITIVRCIIHMYTSTRYIERLGWVVAKISSLAGGDIETQAGRVPVLEE